MKQQVEFLSKFQYHGMDFEYEKKPRRTVKEEGKLPGTNGMYFKHFTAVEKKNKKPQIFTAKAEMEDIVEVIDLEEDEEDVTMEADQVYPKFVAEMKDSNVGYPFQLNVPIAFSRLNLPCFSTDITIQNLKGNIWKIRFYCDSGMHMFTNGWKVFALDNALRKGDHCEFELVDECKMLCQIFRVDRPKRSLEDSENTSTTRGWTIYEESTTKRDLSPKNKNKKARTLAPEVTDTSSCVDKLKSTRHVSDQVDSVDSFLESMGLEKYLSTFKAEEIDMTALKFMDEDDFKSLCIPMGPRKKILAALDSKAKALS
ncbi:hypothetical protein AQUCO_00100015v1 [Aquilegia coerulea]|uniref:TF-B3 domain-containing protein n=1 Tax=Aquilegia coerulea TaxID=218851 RepID=A0A2G5F899_AQUCA|nr:hypothetical protein AQUCO_00100015v1 [Aquilegia coerulea]